MTFQLILIGLLTGAITGVTGASGVLVVVPLLSTFFDLPLPAILGTSLLVDVIASISVCYTYWRNKHVDMTKSLWLLVGALLGAPLGSFFVIGFSKLLIILIIAVSMLFFGINLWRSGVTKKIPRFIVLAEPWATFLQRPGAMIILGFLVGLATGLLGAGGGLTIFVILYSLMRLPIKTAVGTSTLVMFLTAFSGVFGYVKYNNLNLETGFIIGLAAALGGALSARLANRVPDHILARLIGIFFIFLAAVMLVLRVVMPFAK